MKQSIFLAACGALVTATTFADSYPIPTNYQVVCLDLATGKIIWQRKPPELAPPHIAAGDTFVIAKSGIQRSRNESKQFQFAFDAATGKPLGEYPPLPIDEFELSEPLEQLPRNLESADGTVLKYEPGNVRHLIALERDQERIVKKLESWPFDIHVAGDLVLYHFESRELSSGARSADVYAYDLKSDQIAWKFEAAGHLPGLVPGTNGMAVDGQRVLVAVDQTIFALAIETGEVLWKRSLPRQPIRRFDSPWTKFGRHGDKLVVACYEGLGLLRADDGKLDWWFDCGWFGRPWPTIRGEHVYLAMCSPDSALEHAAMVFTGEVVKVEPAPRERWQNISVNVDRVWKGGPSARVVLGAYSQDSTYRYKYRYEPGKKYLFYGFVEESDAQVPFRVAWRTRALESAAGDLASLGESQPVAE